MIDAVKLRWQVSSSPMECMRIHESGRLLACGSLDGLVTLLDVGTTLSQPRRGEREHSAQRLAQLTSVTKLATARELDDEAQRLRQARANALHNSTGSPSTFGSYVPSDALALASVTGSGRISAARRRAATLLNPANQDELTRNAIQMARVRRGNQPHHDLC